MGKKDITRSHATVLIQQAWDRQLVPKGAVSGSPQWDGLPPTFPCMEPKGKEGQRAVRLKGKERELRRRKKEGKWQSKSRKGTVKKEFLQTECNLTPQRGMWMEWQHGKTESVQKVRESMWKNERHGKLCAKLWNVDEVVGLTQGDHDLLSCFSWFYNFIQMFELFFWNTALLKG